jgi:hypothetical protein
MPKRKGKEDIIMSKVKVKKGILTARGKSPIVPMLTQVNEVQKAAATLLCSPECGKGCRTKLALSEYLRRNKKK